MPNLTVGDKLLFTLRYRQQGQTLLNTQVVLYDAFDPSITDDYEAFANAMMAVFAGPGGLIPLLRAETVSDLNFVDMRVQKIHPARWAPIVVNIAANGLNGAAAAPINSAAVLTKRTLLATRYGIGSWHQPGLPQSAMTNAGVWDGPTLTNFKDALEAAFVGSISPGAMVGTYTGILWSRLVPARVTNVTGFVPQSTIRVMRRRTVGVGK